ncbi:uncharacterized protein LOC133197495 [Saccostrea echinata]|uniref:uncharacterized protein LOC133197495 n=1 Tax=Saccostrea echinata TaxID=191078 RepID=UPI002A7F9C83|nr:uncharacterized protein LOC133197495 [Saccostrea echinata]
MTIHGSARGQSYPRGASVSSYSSTGSGMEQTTPLLLEPNDFSGGSHSRSSSVREQRGTRGTDSSRGLLPPTPGVIRGGSFREPGELRQKAEKYRNRGIGPQVCDENRGGPSGSSPDLLSVSYEDVGRGKPDPNLRRVRSFKTTSKGVVNRGDSFRKKGGRCGGYGKESPPRGLTPNVSPHLSGSPRLPPRPPLEVDNNPSYFKIVALGAPGVGKTAITNQFMTSEYIAFDSSLDQGEHEKTICVLLNGVESTVEVLDGADMQSSLEDIRADAFLVIFSIAHRDTFDAAVQLLQELRMDLGTDRTTILVGNKSDLVRKRKVTTEEALELAHQFDAKYTETSAALNHNVDELLVGTIDHIRHKLNPSLPEPVLKLDTRKSHALRVPSFIGPFEFLSRLFRRGNKKSKKF